MPLLAPGKPLALLTFLALSPGRSASREFLLDLLWADVHGDRARHALRQTIWQLRQLLGESALLGREEIRLALPILTDRDQFLAAVEAGDLAAAVARYTGPFLPAFAAPGGTEFEHWADRERDHLRGLFLRAADSLARRPLARGQPREAVQLARRIREAEPLHEGGWRLLLESLTAAHDPVQALVEADALEELLRVEERDPEPATRAAIRAARQAPDTATAATDHPVSLVAELVGREAEFSRLSQAWEQARLGPAAHVLITAPAGLGKSRLLHDVHARLKTLGARTVLVRANPGERDLPFALAADLAGALGELPGAAAIPPAAAGTLVALNPALSARFTATAPADSGDQVLQRGIALAELVNAVAYEAPVAILVDDLHWADPQSTRVVAALLPRITTARALVIMASRHDRDRALVPPSATQLPLAPLGREEVRALLASLGRVPNAEDGVLLVNTLTRASGGSPLHVLDALHQAIENDHLALVEGTWAIQDREGLIREIEGGGSIAGRVQSLDRPARYLLTLLATAGAPCSTELLAQAAAREGASVQDGLTTLEQRGFITRTGGEWEPAHDEIAQTALDLADPPTRQAATRALGEALARSAGADDMVFRRAMQLLADGGADRITPILVAQRPQLCRLPRRTERLDRVADLLGREAGDALVEQVVEALPRPRRWAWLAAAAAVLVVGGVAAAAMVRPADGGDVPTLFITVQDQAGARALRRVVVRPESWTGQGTLPSRSTRIGIPDLGQGFGGNVLSVKGRKWALLNSPSVNNVRTHEVARTDRRGTVYLTESERDDGAPTLSPDRRWIAFTTSRWSARGEDYTDIAIMDSLGQSVRPVTTSTASETYARWDQSGTRLVFLRRFREIRPSEICIATVEGVELACHPLRDAEPEFLLGWDGARSLVAIVARPQGPVLRRIDASSGEFTDLQPLSTNNLAALSPDGRWLACLCPGLNAEPGALRILPLRDPADARIVALPEGSSVLDLAWNSAAAQEGMIERLAVTGLPDRLPRDVSHTPTLTAWNVRDDQVAVPPAVARWWTTDTSVVLVDSVTGRLTPRREGPATIHVTAGGWRSASRTLEVAGLSFTNLVEEGWRQLDSSRWRPFGEPRPYLKQGSGGVSTMVPGGDGSFPSGLYSVETWSAAEGLGVEAELSVPLNRTIWQMLSLALDPVHLHPDLAGWDHRSGATQKRPTTGAAACGLVVPAGEGATWLDYVAIASGAVFERIQMPFAFSDGRWFRVRMQLFPDGSCGYAVNGQPLVRLGSGAGATSRFRLWLTGHAVGTTPMIGPLEVWSGVKPGVDWGVLDR